jgi:flavin-dependent dehydrogenase
MNSPVQLKRDTIKSNYSGSDHYDMVIIGAGLSGLASGLMWMKNTSGMKTLMIEKNSYLVQKPDILTTSHWFKLIIQDRS